MTPRALSFVAVALLAVGASAAVSMSKSWRLTRDDGTGTTSVTMTETPEGVDLLTWGRTRFEAVKMTKDEAASLGRALLEAAGQPEKMCPPSSGFINPGSEPMPYNGGTLKLKLDPWILDGRQCRPIPCPEGRVGCAVNHMVCDEEKKP